MLQLQQPSTASTGSSFNSGGDGGKTGPHTALTASNVHSVGASAPPSPQLLEVRAACSGGVTISTPSEANMLASSVGATSSCINQEARRSALDTSGAAQTATVWAKMQHDLQLKNSTTLAYVLTIGQLMAHARELGCRLAWRCSDVVAPEAAAPASSRRPDGRTPSIISPLPSRAVPAAALSAPAVMPSNMLTAVAHGPSPSASTAQPHVKTPATQPLSGVTPAAVLRAAAVATAAGCNLVSTASPNRTTAAPIDQPRSQASRDAKAPLASVSASPQLTTACHTAPRRRRIIPTLVV